MTKKLQIFLITSFLLAAFQVSANADIPEETSAEQVFQILASEIGLQRGEASLAYQTYMSLARKSKDGRLAQRAVEIAIAGNAPELALNAAKIWDELNPKDAKEIYVTLLMINQRWDESIKPAIEQLKKLKTTTAIEKQINQWRPLLGKATDEDSALNAYFQIVSSSIHKLNDVEILYTFSLSAERVQQYELMEKILRKIIAKNPNDKNALNALGYSFADRNIHLNEASTLLNKAYKLSSEDPYILDSVAWVNFKLGRTQEAITQLQEAFKAKPEAEIGAHLGEVLWSNDEKIAAQEAWKQAEKLDANNKTLKSTLTRLWPTRVPSNLQSNAGQMWDGRFVVKIGAANNGRGGSGAFTLSHDNTVDTLDIRNPLGGSMAKITISPAGAKLEDGSKVYEAHDPDALLQNYLGLPIPARGLSNWLNGEPRLGFPASIERDSLNRASTMIQDNWNISFSWTEKNQLKKMDLKRETSDGPIEIHLIFENIDD
jgi:outer membrane biogenesis lipoprotein LolB